MKNFEGLSKAHSVLDAYLHNRPKSEPSSGSRLQAVTISRQAGSGAASVAEHLIRLLEARKSPARPWTVFDRNLITQVLKDHNLPERLAEYLPEDRGSEIHDTVRSLFGVQPSTWTVVEHTAETILRLVHLGNVIILGRGANRITADVPGVIHVRLVAPLEQRISHVQESRQMSRTAARELVEREDRGRARYFKRYFAASLDDPLLYHLVINTGLVSFKQAAELIVSAAAPLR
ncbi:MAG TPA: cytidylate kinase-like family protein [Verrucomicrobiota bacterium]|nr:cytidylate kinase-like family protein [Verrucomicrobiota bacterium]HNT15350.1 cytidylate kinase-like family protein [Verrucomicrobiota bacterium]